MGFVYEKSSDLVQLDLSVVPPAKGLALGLLLFLLSSPAIFTPQRLDDQTVPDRLGRRFDTAGLSVDDRSNGLNIGFERPAGDSTGLETDSALILRASAVVDRPSRRGSGTGEMADTWHEISGPPSLEWVERAESGMVARP